MIPDLRIPDDAMLTVGATVPLMDDAGAVRGEATVRSFRTVANRRTATLRYQLIGTVDGARCYGACDGAGSWAHLRPYGEPRPRRRVFPVDTYVTPDDDLPF